MLPAVAWSVHLNYIWDRFQLFRSPFLLLLACLFCLVLWLHTARHSPWQTGVLILTASYRSTDTQTEVLVFITISERTYLALCHFALRELLYAADPFHCFILYENKTGVQRISQGIHYVKNYSYILLIGCKYNN